MEYAAGTYALTMGLSLRWTLAGLPLRAHENSSYFVIANADGESVTLDVPRNRGAEISQSST